MCGPDIARSGKTVGPAWTMVVGLLSVFASGGSFVGLADTVELTASQDNTLFENNAGLLSSGAGIGFFAGTTNTGQIRRGLVRFELEGAVPAGSVIDAVRLTLNMSMSSSGAIEFVLHRAEASWGEGASNSSSRGGGGGAPAQTGDATWVHRFFDTELWASPGGDFAGASASAMVASVGPYTWESTSALVLDVQTWLDDPESNFGWLLKAADESRRKTGKRFDSHEHFTETRRPKLSIDYTPPVVGTVFRRGDANVDGAVDVSDASLILQTLFMGEGSLLCLDAADSNDDGRLDVSDAVATLLGIFAGVPIPDPGVDTCGLDSTDDEMDCAGYAAPCA